MAKPKKTKLAKSLAKALQAFIQDYDISLESLSKWYRYLIFQILGPICVGILVLWLFIRIIRHLCSIIWPPTVDELRAQALVLVNQVEMNQQYRKQQQEQHYQEAKKLLQKSIHRDHLYLPSYLTLASIQLYLEKDATESSKTIEMALLKFPKDKDLLTLQLDAKAMKDNMGHMVLTGPLSCRHLECVP